MVNFLAINEIIILHLRCLKSDKRINMNKLVIKLTLSVFVLGVSNTISAQEVDKKVLNWYNGNGAGMETEKAYKMLKKKESTTVIVAIIDSGIDVEHEDLEGKIWTNTDEIPDNGKDDDNNGYIDDVHGWNFLGGAEGENANHIRLEMTRIYADLRGKYEGNDVSISSDEDREEYLLYLEVKEKVESTRARAERALGYYKNLMKSASDEEKKQLQGGVDYFQGQLDYHYNPDFDGRSVVGDDYKDFSAVTYGNNDYEGPDAMHGTHVAGIVGAKRGNDLGGDGVADNVLMMSLRAVPDGDEFDKDIALAIRYAVDNGAQVINMSFGKAYSPNAQDVHDAFAYADSKGVLLVHAAGNDNKDIGEESNFPTPMYDFQTSKLDHWLEIGAAARNLKEGQLAASFSNYSSTLVDVFAPGHEIYNSFPDNKYQAISGTSMACPMVVGAAAMLKSYFPKMTMKEIKDVLLETAKSHKGTMQEMPGGQSRDPEIKADLVDFAKLSVTGSVINLRSAVEKCLEIEAGK
jgi:subtilisin family serine protease